MSELPDPPELPNPPEVGDPPTVSVRVDVPRYIYDFVTVIEREKGVDQRIAFTAFLSHIADVMRSGKSSFLGPTFNPFNETLLWEMRRDEANQLARSVDLTLLHRDPRLRSTGFVGVYAEGGKRDRMYRAEVRVRNRSETVILGHYRTALQAAQARRAYYLAHRMAYGPLEEETERYRKTSPALAYASEEAMICHALDTAQTTEMTLIFEQWLPPDFEYRPDPLPPRAREEKDLNNGVAAMRYKGFAPVALPPGDASLALPPGAEPPGPTIEPAKRKRGRPLGSKNRPKTNGLLLPPLSAARAPSITGRPPKPAAALLGAPITPTSASSPTSTAHPSEPVQEPTPAPISVESPTQPRGVLSRFRGDPTIAAPPGAPAPAPPAPAPSESPSCPEQDAWLAEDARRWRKGYYDDSDT